MNRLRNQISEILEQVSLQAGQVELMVQFGIDALENKSVDRISEIRKLEVAVNKREIEIETECLRALALYHPVANDLQILSTILKANGDLERIADLALNLAERAEALRFSNATIPPELAEMTRYALEMVQDADRALAGKDATMAHDVCKRDDHLDAMNRELIRLIAELMEDDGKQVKAQLHIFSASRIIERIGDHATNIAEDVVFLVEGDIQRHQYKFPGRIDPAFFSSAPLKNME